VGRLYDPPAEILSTLRKRSRDNARTPMQWTAEPGAGFSRGTPWIPVNPNFVDINAADQTDDPFSIYHYYRRLIELRHNEPVVVDGSFALIDAGNEDVYAFRRTLPGREIRVFANLSGTRMKLAIGDLRPDQLLLRNQAATRQVTDELAPWEARVYMSSV
jgi:oligo-1,6-glucosidase